MRLATALSLIALPAFVASHAVPNWEVRYPAAHRRQGLGGLIESLLDPNPTTSSSSTVRPSSSSSATPSSSSSSARPSSSSSVSRPPSSSSSSSSTPPPSSSSSTTSESSTPPPSSSTTSSSETPSTTPTTEAPPETTSSASSSSAAAPSVIIMTVTENGQAVVVTSEAASSAASGESSGLGKGAIIGIAVGAGVAVIAIVTAIIFFARRGRSSSDDEAIRWPELNRHGDSSAVHALPAHRTDGHGSRMSLGSDLDGPSYMTPDSEIANPTSGLNGSNFGATSMLSDNYDEKAYDSVYSDPAGAAAAPHGHHGSNGYGYDDDYTSFPPPVQPQPSPVHGVQYDWEDGSYSDHHQQYAAMQRGGSPPMAMAGVGAGAASFPQAHQPHAGHY